MRQFDRRSILTLSGALAASTLAGCIGDDQGSVADPTPSPTPTPPNGGGSVDDDLLETLAADNAAFAFDLYRALVEIDDPPDNLFYSPYSISVALAMTFAGARGSTAEQMADTLQFGLGDDVHEAFGDMRTALAEREEIEDPQRDETVDAFKLRIANAVWGREDLTFAEAYREILASQYGTEPQSADFAGDPDGERERINDWVADVTEDRIDELLPAGALDASTVSVLVNAIYFLASWLQEFDPDDTNDGTFTALDGSESTVPFMHQHLRTPYADFDDGVAVELPYVGEDVSMVLIKPDDLAAFEADLDADRLFAIFDELGDGAGDLAMPKFEIESDIQLSTVLGDMGMPDAFAPSADFSGMFENGADPWIDEIYHDAVVTVDEEGTEAAAATAVVMTDSAPPDWGEIAFDRPFLFCIRDRPTDAVLFVGRITDAGTAQTD